MSSHDERGKLLFGIGGGVKVFGKLIALMDMPWSLIGYAFVVASALLFSRMKAVLAEFDRTDGHGR